MIRRESLNPKVQGSIPCASTNMLCFLLPANQYVVGGPDALRHRCVIDTLFDTLFLSKDE